MITDPSDIWDSWNVKSKTFYPKSHFISLGQSAPNLALLLLIEWIVSPNRFFVFQNWKSGIGRTSRWVRSVLLPCPAACPVIVKSGGGFKREIIVPHEAELHQTRVSGSAQLEGRIWVTGGGSWAAFRSPRWLTARALSSEEARSLFRSKFSPRGALASFLSKSASYFRVSRKIRPACFFEEEDFRESNKHFPLRSFQLFSCDFSFSVSFFRVKIMTGSRATFWSLLSSGGARHLCPGKCFPRIWHSYFCMWAFYTRMPFGQIGFLYFSYF